MTDTLTPPSTPAGDAPDPVPGPTAGPRSHNARWTALAIGAVLVAFVAVLATRHPASQETIDNTIIGQRVPAVQGPTIDGGTYNIDNARGTWVVVNFFATWCPGCVHEHPELVKFNQWARQSGQAEVVAVVFNDPVDAVKAYFDKNGGGWPVLNAPSIPIQFHVSQIPETFVVAPSGVVVEHFAGEMTADQIIADINAANAADAKAGGSSGPSASGGSS